MKNKILATLGTAAFALGLSASASYAGYFVPGETMGISLDSPLPPGVFFADLETYGRSDNQPAVNAGVNIPVLLWSTPWQFYGNRLEFLAAVPFLHLDGGGVDRVGAVTYALGPILGHDFGNGLTGGISAFYRSPSPSQNIQVIDGRTRGEGDFRESLQYVIPTGPFSGITLIENAGYTTGFSTPAGFFVNDFFAGDFTIEKSFGKFTIGVVGNGNIDTSGNAPKTSSVELGGLIAYDFGQFSLTGMVTRSVLVNGGNAVGLPGYETRGWVRLVVPLYVAPAPVAPVVARY